MTMTATPALPGADLLKQLVQQHRQIKGEPLLLAVHYAPRRDKGDLFLFEIIEDFASDSIDPEKIIFEVTYASTPDFDMGPGRYLHLLLANPPEFEIAVRRKWKGIKELREAVAGRKARVIHKTRKGSALWRLLND